MSIVSELNRLQQAKSDLATSIINKGVTVPSSATLDDYPALVDQIQGGGSIDIFEIMENNIFTVVSGTSPSNANYAFKFNFEDGKKYKIIVKCRNVTPNAITFYTYKTNSNTPNVPIGVLGTNKQTVEFTYTHSAGETYQYFGMWASNSSQRNTNYACSVYIKEIE